MSKNFSFQSRKFIVTQNKTSAFSLKDVMLRMGVLDRKMNRKCHRYMTWFATFYNHSTQFLVNVIVVVDAVRNL